MATFNIDISFPEISYTSKVNSRSVEECYPLSSFDSLIQIVNTNIEMFSLLSNYNGALWDNLTITNILTSNPELILKYNGNPISNSNLPLTINITDSSFIDVLPITLNYSNLIFEKDIETIIISYYIKDINGNIGSTLHTSFQLIRQDCTILPQNDPPVITSELHATILNGGYTIGFQGFIPGIFQYKIEATNNPTSYSYINIPSFLVLNRETGWINLNPIELYYYSTGIYRFNIKATNNSGTDEKQMSVELNHGDIGIDIT